MTADPIFYLHHTYLDKLYWEWQQKNPDQRLTWAGGRTAKPGANASQPLPGPDPIIMDDVLWMAGIVPNVTISEVLDITGDAICADYV